MFPTEGRQDASQDFQELLEHLIVSRSYEVEQARKLRKSQRDRANIVCQRNATYCQVHEWAEVNTPDFQIPRRLQRITTDTLAEYFHLMGYLLGSYKSIVRIREPDGWNGRRNRQSAGNQTRFLYLRWILRQELRRRIRSRQA